MLSDQPQIKNWKNGFELLYEDDDFVAINKPRGILVHRTKISEDNQFVLQLLRNQLGYRIYPVHRLDRGTTGILIFGKNKNAAGLLSEQIRAKLVVKKYLAIIRGFVDPARTIDYPLMNPSKQIRQEAVSHYSCIAQTEMAFEVNRYPSSRYSLVKVETETGRFHQIRRHFAHLRHPVIGDKKHGDCKHNKYFRDQFGLEGLLLHAHYLKFLQSETKQEIEILATPDPFFKKAFEVLKFPREHLEVPF